MKRIAIIKSLSIALLGVILISSCKKEDDVNVTRALVDEWSLNKLSIDNGDGMLDSSEIRKTFDLNGLEIATVTFGELGKGSYMPHTYYYSSVFGNGDFSWSTDDKVQAITATNNRGETQTTKIIFQDYNHFAILEPINYLTYGQGVWNFYSRK